MRHDVIVIGAGPAGATAAYHLAQRGLDVAMMEGRPFPRMKVCGEYLSPAVASLLPHGALHAAGGRRIDRLEFHHAGQRLSTQALPGGGWSLSRSSLDTLLRDRAVHAGATCYQPMTVRGVDYQRDHVLVRTDAGEWRAQGVIHADGSGRHDPAGPRGCRAGVLGMKCHVRTRDDLGSTLQLHSAPGAYLGVVAVERGLATLAMVVEQRWVSQPDALLPEGVERVSDWLSCGVACGGYVKPGHARSWRIGNAAAAVEPVGGEGMGLGIWAGQWIGTRWHPDAGPAMQRALARAYRRRLRLRRPACRLAAWVLMRPTLVRALRPVIAPSPIFPGVLRLTGKPPLKLSAHPAEGGA